MNWRLKAVLEKVLSLTPGRDTVRYWAQRHVTRSLPLPTQDFYWRVLNASEHLDNHREYGRVELSQAVFFEFGAGWDLTVPLVFCAAGVRRQLVYDIDPLVRPWLVGVSVDRLRDFEPFRRDGLFQSCQPDPRRIPTDPPEAPEAFHAWLSSAGIRYVAPGDARATGLDDDSVDCVTNTATLEHIPEADIRSIMGEMYRILRPGGLLSCQIDMSDHYSHTDPHVGPWHFLRYSEREWRRWNPDLLYQNRLRAPTYQKLIADAGFDIRRARLGHPEGFDADSTALPEVHPMFANDGNRTELLATTIQIAAIKPGAEGDPA